MISNTITKGINGEPNIPGDKSISHRSIIIPSISNGRCEINNILKSADVLHTLEAFKSMGVSIIEDKKNLVINGKGLNSLCESNNPIYLGNSGTSARLLAGLLSAQSFNSVLIGDKSLSSRPMKRISEPLAKMNAKIDTTNGSLPLSIKSSNMHAANIELKIPSAQIKSGLLLAALNIKGETVISESKITRDHTEIMLKSFGANIKTSKIKNKKIIKIVGQTEITYTGSDAPGTVLIKAKTK